MPSKFKIDWTCTALLTCKCAHCGATMAVQFARETLVPIRMICTSRQHEISLMNLKPQQIPKRQNLKPSKTKKEEPSNDGTDKETTPDSTLADAK